MVDYLAAAHYMPLFTEHGHFHDTQFNPHPVGSINMDFGHFHAFHPYHHDNQGYYGFDGDLQYLISAEEVQAAKANLKPVRRNGPSFDKNAQKKVIQAARAGLKPTKLQNLFLY